MLSSPDLLHIIVCGDPHRNRVMVMEGGHTQPTTKAVRLPANWIDLLHAGSQRVAQADSGRRTNGSDS